MHLHIYSLDLYCHHLAFFTSPGIFHQRRNIISLLQLPTLPRSVKEVRVLHVKTHFTDGRTSVSGGSVREARQSGSLHGCRGGQLVIDVGDSSPDSQHWAACSVQISDHK